MTSFKAYMDSIRPEINDRLAKILEDNNISPDVVRLLMEGKRLRAGILMLVFENLSTGSIQLRGRALDLGCAVELAHSASLVFDDIIDEDEERRGQKTIHVSKGAKKAMLSGIDILSIPYSIAAQHGLIYIRMLAETQRSMVKGALEELFDNPDLPATKLYDMIITHKTGHLFSMAAEWGCICAEKREFRKTFARYGLYCGKCMQIGDDLADICQIISGKKSSNFGSEMLLLKCIMFDTLVKELINDIKNKKIELSKIKLMWKDQGLRLALNCILEDNMQQANSVLDGITLEYLELESILYLAPREIAYLMKEGK